VWIANNFGNNLKTIRLNNNLTRKEAAALVGVSEAFWGYLERGERNPGFDVIEKIAKVFNISPHILFIDGEAMIDVELGGRIEKIVSLGENHKQFLIKFIDAYLEVLDK
jgi:transcriptional regulator with XRE-family HTH domain